MELQPLQYEQLINRIGNLLVIGREKAAYYGGNDVYPAFIYDPSTDTFTKKDNGDAQGPFASSFRGVSLP